MKIVSSKIIEIRNVALPLPYDDIYKPFKEIETYLSLIEFDWRTTTEKDTLKNETS